MKRAGFCVMALLLVAFIAGCSEKATVDQPIVIDPQPTTEAEAKLIAAGNDFTWNLFREVVASEASNVNKNVFVSPLSASIALGMTYNGARGETQTAMQTTLGFADLTPLEIDQSYQSLIEHYSTLDADVKFEIANSIWHADRFQVEPEFLDVNRTYFDAVVTALNFESPEAVVTINNWVNEKTHGKISTIIDVIPDYVVMYLINALYFKGTWTYQFDREKTGPAQFNCPDGSKVTCQLMNMETDSLRFLRNSTVMAAELPYGNGDYRLLAVMPTNPDSSLDDLIASINSETWSGWLAGLRQRGEPLALPKFKLSYEIRLKKALTDLGMGVAFTDHADFRGINRNLALLIDEVLQKTFVQLDEEGTEAAAVTAVVIGTTNAGPSYIFNRPFLVIIYEHQTGAVMFVGKIVKPEFDS
jgi:serine protease inhibitor